MGLSAGALAVVVAALGLAFANGANDNAKGVATLIGSGRMALRPAIAYATAATLLGSVAAWLLARFGGKGLLAPELIASPALPLAVAAAAGATVLLATRFGLPVSTTHALIGSLGGVGLAAGSLDGQALTRAFVGPLLLSPLVALVVTAAVYPLLRRVRLALGVTHESCVCVASTPGPVTAGGAAAQRTVGLGVVHDTREHCAGYAGTLAGIGAQRALDGCHLFTAGAVSFARGVNDTPKIAALMLLAAPFGGAAMPSMVAIGMAMAAGGLLAARRVATTMSHRITSMNEGQAFTANLTTALLVLVASRFGLPVSTTHVSVGALFGIGAVGGGARWNTVTAVVLSWLVVLPLSAALAAVLWLALRP